MVHDMPIWDSGVATAPAHGALMIVYSLELSRQTLRPFRALSVPTCS